MHYLFRASAPTAILGRSVMDVTADIIEDIGPQPQSFDIERETKENTSYRSVTWSGRYLQVTLMSIPVGGDIGLEAHPETDQFPRLDAGSGRVQMGPAKDKLTFEKNVSNGWCVLVPAGTWHNITNIGATPMHDLLARPPHARQGAGDGGCGRSRQRRRACGLVSATKTRAR
jgi:mannose-6-phosphate isomerase-like protein (cupin superfamily)